MTAIINPHSLSLDSFLLNHSVEYTLAAISSWVEFTVEKLTVPGTPAPEVPDEALQEGIFSSFKV